MANNDKTLYEILGVPRNAKPGDIAVAYRRIRSDLQREAAAPNPRLAAAAKVAHDTLSDPDKRAAYDATLGISIIPAIVAKKSRRLTVGHLVGALAVIALGVGVAAYYFLFDRKPAAAARPADKGLGPQEVVKTVAPHVGRVQAALVSGEVRDLGIAVAIAENEMVTTCRGVGAGMLLTVKAGAETSKAEIARANDDLDICTLDVRGLAGGVKVRPGIPGATERIQAVFVNANGQPEARQVKVKGAIKDSKAPAFELEAAVPLPNGTPLFDSQAQLVGIVAPSAGGSDAIAAHATARIAQARGGASRVAAAGTEGPAASPAPNVTLAPTVAEPRSASPGRRPRGRIVDEGFTTLWREDWKGSLVEVMDNPKTGALGDPIAYWTLWADRDMESNPTTHCLVTYGPEHQVVADYDQVPGIDSPDGYWFCALTRFQVELPRMPTGDYHFTIFVDGEEVAAASTRVERKFWTRDKYAIIVIVVGLIVLIRVGGRPSTWEKKQRETA